MRAPPWEKKLSQTPQVAGFQSTSDVDYDSISYFLFLTESSDVIHIVLAKVQEASIYLFFITSEILQLQSPPAPPPHSYLSHKGQS